MNQSSPPPAGTGTDPEARLRAADPAAGAEPDLVSLRAAVRDRADHSPAEQLATARARRWTGWPARAAAVAAAALVVGGGGGYAIGAADGATPAPPAAGPIAVSAPGAGEAATDGAGPGVSAVGPETSARALEGGADAAWIAPGSGRTVFTSSGLSADGGSAEAWAYDPAASFTEGTIAAAAATLGVEGSPRLSEGTWTVGPVDGSAANVQLYPDGTASLSYYDPTKDPWACPVVDGPTGDDPVAGDEGGSMPAPEPCVERDLGPAPEAEAATARLREVLAAVGLDAGSYEYESGSQPVEDGAWTYVSAWQVVDGQRTGVQWSASFTGAGLQSVHGATAPLVAMGEYPVVSPQAAVERLMDPRFGGFGGPVAYLERAELRAPEPLPAEGARTVPPTVDPGSPVSWPVEQVTVVESRLGVALHGQPDGAAVLLPTYELISDDGAIWSVIAVADEQLDFSSGR